MIGAHVMGMPVEESLLSIAPALAAFIALAGAHLRAGRPHRRARRSP